MSDADRSIEEQLAAAQAKIAALESLIAQAVSFDLGDKLLVKRCPVDANKWVVYQDEWQVLDHNGQWIYEPSRRHHWTTDFLDRTRFNTLKAALDAAAAARGK